MPESPRQRLLKNERLANAHYGIVHGEDFQKVADLALLQVVSDVRAGVNTRFDPASNYAFIAGAQYMLEALQSIANPEPENPKNPRTDRLDPNL